MAAGGKGALAAARISLLLQNDFTPGSGNALQAAVASALGLPGLEGVPNFVAAPEGYEASLVAWLKKRGLGFAKLQLDSDSRLPAGEERAAGLACIVRGTSPRGNFGHVVVGHIGRDGRTVEMAHDPHPDGQMLQPPLVWCALFPSSGPAGREEEGEGSKKRLRLGCTATDAVAVGVTGCNGFIASHVVAQCLGKGYVVHGTVRDANDAKKTAHLSELPGAAERLKLFSADLLREEGFRTAFAGCRAVFHVASPLPMGKGVEDPDNLVIRPAVEGVRNVLQACKVTGVGTVVVTSSMSAMAPVPEPALKSEEHWSDPEGQKERGSFYGAGKTLAEQAAYSFVGERAASMRFVSICPTMVVGPMLQPSPNMTMLSLCDWFKNGRAGADGRCPNDSMSFVDVRDCAAQHIAAMEDEKASGRFMSLAGSLHWNDLSVLMREIYPRMPVLQPCEGILARPTQFDRTRQDSLGVKLRNNPQILREAAEELKSRGLLAGSE